MGEKQEEDCIELRREGRRKRKEQEEDLIIIHLNSLFHSIKTQIQKVLQELHLTNRHKNSIP